MLHSRTKRVEELLRETLSNLFQREVKDPRLPKLFTITKVNVGKDLRDATVYFSQLPDDDEAVKKTRDFLFSSRGYLRTLLAREANLRMTPTLHFSYDPGEKNFQRINSVLNKLKKEGQLPPEEEPQ